VDRSRRPPGQRADVPDGTVGANSKPGHNVASMSPAMLEEPQHPRSLRTGGAALRDGDGARDDPRSCGPRSIRRGSRRARSVSSARPTGKARVCSKRCRAGPARHPASSGATTGGARPPRRGARAVRTLAHAEGGGVLYVHSEADRERALAMAEAALDRLGVCNRLNLALVDRGAAELLPDLLAVFREKGLEVRGTPRAVEAAGGRCPAPRPRAPRVRVGERARPRRDRDPRPGRRPRRRGADRERGDVRARGGIVTEDAEAANRFLDGYRGRPRSGTPRRASRTVSS
jgi:glutamate-5-semialdehyde dehydrogenase